MGWDRVDCGSIPHLRQVFGRLLFHSLGCLRGRILSFCCGVILIVARHSLRNLFCGELAVIFGMQNVVERTRIRGHRLIAPYFPNVDKVATRLHGKCRLCLLNSVCCFAALAGNRPFGHAAGQMLAATRKEARAEQQRLCYCTAETRRIMRFGCVKARVQRPESPATGPTKTDSHARSGSIDERLQTLIGNVLTPDAARRPRQGFESFEADL